MTNLAFAQLLSRPRKSVLYGPKEYQHSRLRPKGIILILVIWLQLREVLYREDVLVDMLLSVQGEPPNTESVYKDSSLLKSSFLWEVIT